MSMLPMPIGLDGSGLGFPGFDPTGGFQGPLFGGGPGASMDGAMAAGYSPDQWAQMVYGGGPGGPGALMSNQLIASILGNQQSGQNAQTAANASMFGSGANAAANEQNGYLQYLANVLQANNSLQGQLGTAQIGAMSANNIAATNAGAADYATDEQRQAAALQNQAQNLASSVTNQDALANTAANQFATQAGMQNELVNAQQQQLATDANRYATQGSMHNAGVGAQAGEQEAATSAAASELPSLLKYNMSSQLINSPLVSSIMGSSFGGGSGGSLLSGLGGAGSSPFSVNPGFNTSAIQGAINAAQNPNLFQPQQANYQQSQFAPPTPNFSAPTVPTGLSPSNFLTAPNVPVPVGSGHVGGGGSLNLNTNVGPLSMSFSPATPATSAAPPPATPGEGGPLLANSAASAFANRAPAVNTPSLSSFPTQKPITGVPAMLPRPNLPNLPSSALMNGGRTAGGARLS